MRLKIFAYGPSTCVTKRLSEICRPDNRVEYYAYTLSKCSLLYLKKSIAICTIN